MRISSQATSRIGVAVVVTCHEAYSAFLPKVLKSIIAQSVRFAQFILVLDNVTSLVNTVGWEVVRINSGNPNKARNEGIKLIKGCDWVVHWDGDNVMAETFLRDHLLSLKDDTARNIGFFYPTISYREQINLSNNSISRELRTLEVPEFEYNKFHDNTYVDTSSMWRLEAIKSAGYWNEDQPKYDDWDLSLRVTRLGWIGKKSKATSNITIHENRRSSNGKVCDAIWSSRSLGIITLWSGKSNCTDDVLDWYKNATIPKNTSLYWLDNSGDELFSNKLWKFANVNKERFTSITIIKCGEPYVIKTSHKEKDRHQYVADLYNKIIPRVYEDLSLFIEDDNVAGYSDLRTLSDSLLPNQRIAAVGAAYRSRNSPHVCCAAINLDEWIDCPNFDLLRNAPLRVGMIGGGFTLYLTSALKKALPMSCMLHERKNALIGWDGQIGRTFTKLGYQLILHGGVKIEHKCNEVLEFLETRKQYELSQLQDA